MVLEVFELERFQSIWENTVKYNLTESGVQPLLIEEVLSTDDLVSEFLKLKVGYSQTNGTPLLRDLISQPFSNANAENVLVTCGGAEANFISTWYLLKENNSRNELVVMLPNYLQIDGLGKMLGGKVLPFNLEMNRGEWTPDIEGLKSTVSKRTTAIAICNPNNPTGTILSDGHLKAIAEIAQDNGAWILSDEIYRGVEHSGKTTTSMFDTYDKVIITNSLSKVYGLPGLRLGWILCSDPDVTGKLWAYTDYTTIGPSSVSDWFATKVLQPDTRETIAQRARGISSKHWSIMKEWLDSHGNVFEYAQPRAASFCFPRYTLDIDAISLMHRLREEKSVLVAPGDYFGFPKHLRIGFGYAEENLRGGLQLVSETIQSLL